MDMIISLENEDDDTAAEASSRDKNFNVTNPRVPPMDGLRTHKHQGSRTSLSAESSKAVNWVHSIPWYLKPVMPGFCNLFNSAMRWGSLIYISASIAKILISGMELVLSVFCTSEVDSQETGFKVMLVRSGHCHSRSCPCCSFEFDRILTEITQPCVHTCDGLFICQLYSLHDLLEETDCKEDTSLTFPFASFVSLSQLVIIVI
jgi:hypothetical protein